MQMQDLQQQSLSTKELQHNSHMPFVPLLMDQALLLSDPVQAIA